MLLDMLPTRYQKRSTPTQPSNFVPTNTNTRHFVIDSLGLYLEKASVYKRKNRPVMLQTGNRDFELNEFFFSGKKNVF